MPCRRHMARHLARTHLHVDALHVAVAIDQPLDIARLGFVVEVAHEQLRKGEASEVPGEGGGSSYPSYMSILMLSRNQVAGPTVENAGV